MRTFKEFRVDGTLAGEWVYTEDGVEGYFRYASSPKWTLAMTSLRTLEACCQRAGNRVVEVHPDPDLTLDAGL